MGKVAHNKLNSWAQLRFSVIGGLLARPPEKGKLRKELETLARHSYPHPTKDELVTFGVSTIERWYYQAQKTDDPITALARKLRSDVGSSKAMSSILLGELGNQYKRYSSWSYKLHADNLAVLVEEKPELGPTPSYSTVARRMKERGWYKKAIRRNKTKGQELAAERLEKLEVRSYESTYVHGLWHLDFHHCSLRVIDAQGKWRTPIALCILDDCSRLCCHIQWYFNETAEVLQHGLIQAFHKRGLPRSLMTDNGSAMLAHETRNGLMSSSIEHKKTLPYSPYQNGKQESFWGQLEGRMVAMLRRVKSLSLEKLNYITQAWAEIEYNRAVHDEIDCSPVERVLSVHDVSRPSLESEKLKFFFTVHENRIQRQSDGTITVKGVRFEVPSRLRHLKKLTLHYQSWDLSQVWLVDPLTSDKLALIYPQDKTQNNHGQRRALQPLPEDLQSEEKEDEEYPPLMRKLLASYAATGVPPAYIPKEDEEALNEE